MQKNDTLLQCFEWYLPDDGQYWKRLKASAPSFCRLGVNVVWLPPAYKGAAGIHDVGYGVYDLYDLGEFDQKDTVATKYGTKQEYLSAIRALQNCGIKVLGDIVLNHRMGADQLETIWITRNNPDNRNEEIGESYSIDAWTAFTFPARNGKYSDFCWNAKHFDGTDWDEKGKKKDIYLIDGKEWDHNVDSEDGNYDYLMGCDVDFTNPEVLQELDRWGKWYLDVSGIDGVRIDAVKHIDDQFFKDWLKNMRAYRNEDFFAVGEYWHADIEILCKYLDRVQYCMSLFDVSLHFQLLKASNSNGSFDMRTLFTDTLVSRHPWNAVTFVDNHDTEPGQALESYVLSWFKPQAYALILLRRDGFPCVFHGDLYGIPAKNIPPVIGLPILMKIRELCAYGEQHDYFDDADVVGWTREGSAEMKESGLAVVLSNGKGGRKQMYVGKRFADMRFTDALRNIAETVTIDENGFGVFGCQDAGISVWLPKQNISKVSLD